MTAKASPSVLLTEPLTGQEWRADAACLGHDPELWFADDGDEGKEKRSEAIRICRACPVRKPCLNWAMRVNDRYAILGGLTKRQRTALRKRVTRWKNFTLLGMAGRIPGAGGRSRTSSPSPGKNQRPA